MFRKTLYSYYVDMIFNLYKAMWLSEVWKCLSQKKEKENVKQTMKNYLNKTENK